MCLCEEQFLFYRRICCGQSLEEVINGVSRKLNSATGGFLNCFNGAKLTPWKSNLFVEANDRTADQEILHIVWNSKIHFRPYEFYILSYPEPAE